MLHSRLIGRYCSTSDLSPSLKIGLTLHFFHSCGYLPLFIQVWKISVNEFDRHGRFFKIMLPLLSGPVAFVMYREVRTDLISFWEILSVFNRAASACVFSELVTLIEDTCKEMVEHFTFHSIICSCFAFVFYCFRNSLMLLNASYVLLNAGKPSTLENFLFKYDLIFLNCPLDLF